MATKSFVITLPDSAFERHRRGSGQNFQNSGDFGQSRAGEKRKNKTAETSARVDRRDAKVDSARRQQKRRS